MFCLPDGDAGADEAGTKLNNQKRRELFAQLFVKCVKRLKGEFGDSIKVGGPALCWLNEEYFRYLLQACKDAGVAPDFISWHGYKNNPSDFSREADRARRMCDEMGFPKCELIVNEWHYFGENYSWGDMQRCSDPAVKERIWSGPDSHNGIRSACFTLATLVDMQSSKLDQAFYYGCSHVGSWGFKDSMQKKYKVFYALKLFGDIMGCWSWTTAGRPARSRSRSRAWTRTRSLRRSSSTTPTTWSRSSARATATRRASPRTASSRSGSRTSSARRSSSPSTSRWKTSASTW